MQRNSGKMRIIKNIIILSIMLMTVITIYYNIRNSMAESTFELTITLDKSAFSSGTEIKTTANENSDGTYTITLPKWSNNFAITKYKIERTDANNKKQTIEIPVTGENTQTKINLTANEVKNKKIEMQTEKDSFDVEIDTGTKDENGNEIPVDEDHSKNEIKSIEENYILIEKQKEKADKDYEECNLKVNGITGKCTELYKRKVNEKEKLYEVLQEENFLNINEVKENVLNKNKIEELKEELRQMMKIGVENEINWGKYVIGDKIQGINSNLIESYIKYLGNRRLKEIGFEGIFSVLKET